MQRIILASGSKQRKMLMDGLGIPFTVIPADLDEKSIQGENAEKRIEKLARMKAEKVAASHKGIIIAADTVCIFQNNVLEKPETLEEARTMLHAMSKNEVGLLTGFCYLDLENDISVSTVVQNTYKFRELYRDEVEEYVNNQPVLTWAGGFAPAYPYGATFIADMKGSYTAAIYGLPAEILIPLLQKSGISLHPKPLQ